MIRHKTQAAGKWFTRSLIEQLANVGMDVERAIRARNQGNQELSRLAIERALELLSLTKSDPKNRKRLKEVCRMYELLVDYFYYDNIYRTDDTFLHNYFYQMNYAAALQRGR